jgi:G3E family GTPase
MLQHHFHIEGVVATVDAVNGQRHLDRHPASRKQVVVADEIIVTKTDMVQPDAVELLVVRLRQMNPSAHISPAIFGDVDPARLWRPGRGMAPAARCAAEGSEPAVSHMRAAAAGQHRHAEAAIRAIAFTFEQPLDWIAFSVWLSMLLHAHGEDVLRVKGLLNVGTAGPVVLNGVQHIIHAPEHLASWPDADQRSRLVFILQGLSPHDITQSLRAFQHLLGAQPCPDDTDRHR